MRHFVKQVAVLLVALALLAVSLTLPVGVVSGSEFTSPVGGMSYRVMLPLVVAPSVASLPPIPTLESWQKRGVGTSYGGHCEDVSRSNSYWHYNWGPWVEQCVGSQAVPMFWGNETMTGTLPSFPSNMPMLVLNEPNEGPPQANLTPLQGARFWHSVQMAYPTNPKVGPAVSDRPDGASMAWLYEWRAAYFGEYREYPEIYALAVHCYRWTAGECRAWIESFFDEATAWTTSGKVWVSEFAHLQGGRTIGEAVQHGAWSVGWMQDPVLGARVERYAWFATRYMGTESWAFGEENNTSLFNFWSGAPTAFGSWYGQ